MTCTVPLLSRNGRSDRSFALADSGTMAPLASAGSPGVQLIVDTVGTAVPEGNRVRWPKLFGWVMVTLSATALASAGTPQLPRMGKLRTTSLWRMGPPVGPAGLRVS